MVERINEFSKSNFFGHFLFTSLKINHRWWINISSFFHSFVILLIIAQIFKQESEFHSFLKHRTTIKTRPLRPHSSWPPYTTSPTQSSPFSSSSSPQPRPPRYIVLRSHPLGNPVAQDDVCLVDFLTLPHLTLGLTYPKFLRLSTTTRFWFLNFMHICMFNGNCSSSAALCWSLTTMVSWRFFALLFGLIWSWPWVISSDGSWNHESKSRYLLPRWTSNPLARLSGPSLIWNDPKNHSMLYLCSIYHILWQQIYIQA